ncbi:M48 family metallopeptidase [Sphingomonas sp. Y38-1Y]|uniref:M48 family metallopeptidase n=1 Tax=Sphingomonas sp. Y38-1Y TaxID=3078265 RepID=UPI0028F0A271|nr:M48 family metallopeptidase [Sphingomonas sp. Y38-1Y]
MRFNRRAQKTIVLMAALLLGPMAAVGAEDYAPTFEALRTADTRLQTIGERLAVAAAPWCRRQQPALGLALHGPDQYLGPARAAAITHFRFDGPLGVAGIVPGGTGAASVRRDDSLIALEGEAIAELPTLSSDTAATARLAAFDRAVAMRPPGAPVTLTLRRDSANRTTTLKARPACRARFEQRDADDNQASADGVLVQISSRFLTELDDDAVAVLVAHELSHNVLEHRRRLDEAGVRRGLLSNFGRNASLFRQSEVEADILAVHLLARAGYDPALAAQVWKRIGPRYAGGLRSATHPGWRDRVATMATEAPRASASGSPAILAARNKPIDGDWRSILVRAR